MYKVCYRPNVSVPNIHKRDGIKRQGPWEVMGSGLLWERLQRQPVPSAMWGLSEKKAACKPGREPSPDSESAGTLNLDIPAPRAVRNKRLLCKPLGLSVYGIFVMAARTDWDKALPRYLWDGKMITFIISKGRCWFWIQPSRNPEFCRSQAERAREETGTLAVLRSAAREKCISGGDSDLFLREKFPGHKNHIWSSRVS